MSTIWQDNAARFATRTEDRDREIQNMENSVVHTNLAYARASRGQFPHARALVMAEAITNLVQATDRRTS